jgi:hypothetical protein
MPTHCYIYQLRKVVVTKLLGSCNDLKNSQLRHRPLAVSGSSGRLRRNDWFGWVFEQN